MLLHVAHELDQGKKNVHFLDINRLPSVEPWHGWDNIFFQKISARNICWFNHLSALSELSQKVKKRVTFCRVFSNVDIDSSKSWRLGVNVADCQFQACNPVPAAPVAGPPNGENKLLVINQRHTPSLLLHLHHPLPSVIPSAPSRIHMWLPFVTSSYLDPLPPDISPKTSLTPLLALATHTPN